MSSGVASKAYTAGFGQHMVPVTRAGEEFAGDLKDKDMGKAPGTKSGKVWWPKAIASCQCSTAAMAAEWDRWGANVGLATGRKAQLVAIDVDFDDPGAAHIANTILRKHFKIYRGVDTPGHHRFMYPVRIKDTLPKGTVITYVKGGVTVKLEILGEGRQFVALGIHAIKLVPYTWSVDITEFVDGVYEFPEITLEQFLQIIDEVLMALTDAGWVKTSGSVTGNSAVTGTVERRTCTEYELTRWLALIPNTDTDNQFDDRAAWVGMAHAIKGASDGAAWGHEMWLAWCNQRSQSSGEPEKVWDSLKDDGRLGLDYIRGKAAERNAKLAAQLDFEMAPPIDEDTINAIAQGAVSGALWPLLLQRYVWVAAHDMFLDLATGEEFTTKGLDGKLGHLAHKLQSEAFQKAKGKLRFSQMFFEHPDTLKVDNVAYWPGQTRLVEDDTGRVLANRWKAAKFRHVPNVSRNDIAPWIDLVEFVVGKHNNPELFIKYCALVIKYPGVKPNYAPVTMTDPGLGKDTLLIPVILGVGAGNHFMLSADVLSGHFKPFTEHRLVYMSETRQHSGGGKSGHDVMNDLKAYLADKPEWVGTERKNKDVYPVRNLTAWFFFSNEKRPLYVAEGDRRLWIIDNMGVKKKDPAYYAKLNKWLDSNAHLVASFLQDYPLTAADIEFFKGPAPDTTAKSMLIQSNRDPVEVALADIIEEARKGGLFASLVVTHADLVAELKQRVAYVPGGQIVGSHLRALGVRPAVPCQRGGTGAGVVSLPGNKSVRLWVLADSDDAGRDYSKLSLAEIKQVFTDAKWPTPQYPTGNGTVLTAINGGEEI